jgi:DNA-binding transcriptional ArsR family regulator
MTEPVGGRLRVQSTAGMRALAHPARLASLEHLMRVGPSTATELGEIVGLTPSAMSYHLRALERAGLIEDAAGRGDGRERVWRSSHPGIGFDVETPDDGSEESLAASVQLMEAAVTVDEVETRRWLGRSGEPGWTEYGTFMSASVLLNQQELVELGARISELMEPYRQRNRTGEVPDDAVTMRAYFKCFPSA